MSPHFWLLPTDKHCQQELIVINKGTCINHVQAEPNTAVLIIIQYSFLTSLWVHMPITRNMLPSAVSSWNLVFIVFRCAPLKIKGKKKKKKKRKTYVGFARLSFIGCWGSAFHQPVVGKISQHVRKTLHFVRKWSQYCITLPWPCRWLILVDQYWGFFLLNNRTCYRFWAHIPSVSTLTKPACSTCLTWSLLYTSRGNFISTEHYRALPMPWKKVDEQHAPSRQPCCTLLTPALQWEGSIQELALPGSLNHHRKLKEGRGDPGKCEWNRATFLNVSGVRFGIKLSVAGRGHGSCTRGKACAVCSVQAPVSR